ncbi:MAG: DNA mismatch repair protein MutS [Planctomycetota bacterium]|nr:MAG: DNA mismatch repair protein MutS [Planctomycetota bacterium]
MAQVVERQRAVERPEVDANTTPLMRQYLTIKAQHEGDVLFFRMGDFYEMFYEDAELVSRVLGIALTSRGHGKDGYAMAGFPYHALDRYLPTMIAAGYRVAICEQVEDPALVRGKKVVRREVVEVHTPGTLTDDKLLEAKAANYLLALHLPRRNARRAGLAWFEASSGRFLVAEVPLEAVEVEVERIGPAEILLAEGLARLRERPEARPELAALLDALAARAPVSTIPDWVLRHAGAREALQERFGVATLAGLGLRDDAPYVPAAAAALHYVGEKKPGFLDTLDRWGRGIELYRPEEHLALDPATARCLEITRPLREGSGPDATLLGAIDRTRTAMGGRTLREWLLAPLRDPKAIAARQDAVAALLAAPAEHEALGEALRRVYDLERLATRIASGRAAPRDLAALRDSLAHLPAIQAAARGAADASEAGSGLLLAIAERLDPLAPLQETLARALAERPSQSPKDGPIFAAGWSAELDRLRQLSCDQNELLAQFQAREIERTGIPSLKVGYNKVFGYYIEVTQAHKAKVPERYVRKQTLKNAERFLTPELKELEADILSARDKQEALEAELFVALRERVGAEAQAIVASATAAAELDVLASLATLARERGYVRPRVEAHDRLRIVQGRHPVLDLRAGGERFVPNDVVLGGEEAGRLHLITGPNMAGKSTYIRQAALLVLLAQTGSYVPAAAAEVGVVDRIFARIGAGDELTQGLSTFMVEMTETANILRNATERSLVILDEVGRGTSTYDGVSLAWAIAEHLHDVTRARTLFATHYHELTALAATKPGVRNRNVAVEERGDEVVFLHQIVPGSADRSYGIHVARLAGLPPSVLRRAAQMLRGLEDGTFDPAAPLACEVEEAQLPLFTTVKEDRLRARLREVVVEETTPLEALQLLDELKRIAGG